MAMAAESIHRWLGASITCFWTWTMSVGQVMSAVPSKVEVPKQLGERWPHKDEIMAPCFGGLPDCQSSIDTSR
jgi:hypothetical protein